MSKRKTNLETWTDILREDLRFMREHGWVMKAYVARYGTAEKPKMGDGGPAIWAADLAGHMYKREKFNEECVKYLNRKKGERLPDYAHKMLFEMNVIPHEIDRIFAKALDE